MRIIASIEDPAVIEKILAHIERRNAASPHAPRAPPASSGRDPPWHPMSHAQAVPLNDTATTPFVQRTTSGGLSRTSGRKWGPGGGH